MYYVYRYVGQNGTVLYVGITNNLKNRICQHQRDKLSEISKSAKIEYFPVKYQEDADLLETYLISHFKTGQYFNVSKTKKGNVSFLRNCEYLPWVVYDGCVEKKLKPFTLSVGSASVRKEERELLHRQNVYRRKFLRGLLRSLDREYKKEKRDFNHLNKLTGYSFKDDVSCTKEELMTGISLHGERCDLLGEYYNDLYDYLNDDGDDVDFQKYIDLLNINKNKITSHEHSLLVKYGEG